MPNIIIQLANKNHLDFASIICKEMTTSAKQIGTGIAIRTPAYIQQKIMEGKAVIALSDEGHFVGFCYIETWQLGKYIANSGLIVANAYRKSGVAKRIKKQIFEISRNRYPELKIFGLTTGPTIMKINSELGYTRVTYSEMTNDEQFWNGCKSCNNYAILASKNFQNCLCTAMLYDPNNEASAMLKELPAEF